MPCAWWISFTYIWQFARDRDVPNRTASSASSGAAYRHGAPIDKSGNNLVIMDTLNLIGMLMTN
jgi:hypothetical protein